MDSRDDTRPPPIGSQFYEASFIQSASSPASVLMVRVDAFGDAPFGDPGGVVWSPLGNALPAAGDRCLVAESDDGSWWVLAWWSGGQAAADPALGGKTIRSGSATLTWAGTTNSNTITITHGFPPGMTPTEIVATGYNAPAFGNVPTVQAANAGLTTFQMNGEVKTAFTGSIEINWIAAG